MGTTGPASLDPATGEALWPRLSPWSPSPTWCARRRMLIDHLGIDTLFCVAGGSMGGMQVLQWAAAYPERVFAAMPIATAARHSSQNIAFHEVGRQAIMADPGLARRALSRRGHSGRRRGSRWRAWPRISPICRKRRCTANSAANCRTAPRPTFSFDADFQVESYLRHQGIDLRRPLRRQFLSLYHPRDGLFRSRRRLRRRRWPQAFQGTKTRFCVVSFTSDWLYPDPRIARHRPCAERRRRPRSPSSRSRPTRATTPSCSTSRNSSRPRGASSTAPPGARPGGRGKRDDLDASRRPAATRRASIFCWSPSMVDAGLARARRRLRRRRACCACSPRTRTSTARGIELSQQGVNDCVGQGPVGDPGRRRHRSRRLSRRRLRLRHPVARPCRRRASRARCWRTCCASAGAPSSRSRISAIGACGCSSRLRGRMPVTEHLTYAWYDTPNIHFCTIRDFIDLAREVGAVIDNSVALDQGGAPVVRGLAEVDMEPRRRTGDLPAAPPKPGAGRRTRGRRADAGPPGGCGLNGGGGVFQGPRRPGLDKAGCAPQVAANDSLRGATV